MSYQELLRDRSSVAHLLKHVGTLERDSGSGRVPLSWIAPPDSWKILSGHSVLAKVETEGTENGDGTGDDTSTVVSGLTTLASETSSSVEGVAETIPKELQINTLAKLQRSILAKNGIHLETKGTSLITSSQNLSSKKVMVDLRAADMSYPGTEGIPPCPEMAEVERGFYKRTLNIEVHNMEGFSFTSEFELVYKGKTSNESAFGDFVTICKRAFLTLDPTFDDDMGARYAKMIARMCLWERSIAAEVCAKALQTTVPHLNAEMQVQEPFAPLKIFIGKDRSTAFTAADSIQVWLRYCPRIQPREMDARATPDVKKAEKKAHIAMQLCSYRCVQLSRERVDEFEQWCTEQVENPAAKLRATKRRRYMADRERKMAGKKRKPLESEPSATFPAPPLPDRTFPPQASQWSMHLFCRQNFKAGASDDANELYDDEDEEAQVWSIQSLVGTTEQALAQTQAQGSDASVASGNNISVDTRETLKRRIARALASDPSACSELVGWGHDSDHSLGIGGTNRDPRAMHDNIHAPRPVPMPASLALERIKYIACSARHTLVLSCLGNLYVCGENSEGALGLGDMRSRNVLTLLQWPMGGSNKTDSSAGGASILDAPPKIAKVAAGCGPIGSHSMCIDSEGLLYGWGVPQAVGLGSVQPVLAPRLIDTFPRPLLSRHNENEAEGESTAPVPNNLDLDDETALGGPPCALPVADVSCGGGFTVCILRDGGRVCSWGTWQHGRLGQGPTPTIKAARGYGSGDKLARYKLRPAYVRGLKNAVQVSCGESHALCVLASGEVKAWGQNSCGQLGFGPNNMGYLRDSLRPVTVPPFFGNNAAAAASAATGTITPLARSVCAGPYHSCVVDTSGTLWTFGGRGSACLGHNDAFLTGDWTDRLSSIFAIATNALQVMIPYELLPWVRTWSVPRKVLSLSQHVVQQAVAGDQSTCVLTADGHFLVCGSGAVSPPIVSASLEQDSMREIEKQFGDALEEDDEVDNDDEDEGEDGDGDEQKGQAAGTGGEEKESLLARARARHEKRKEKKARLENRRAEEHAKLIADKAMIVKTFRRPSASWLAEVSGRRALLVASGGTRCFAVMDEENVAATLTSSLLKSTMRPTGRAATAGADDESTDLDSQADTMSVGSYFDVRGRADCILLVSGKMILCHRAILAARSNELRDMIAQETPSDDYSVNSAYYAQQPTQLLLPELHVDSARALLSFLYTDILPTSCIGNVSMLQSLQRVSRSLRLPRLQVVCERLLDNLTAAEMARNDDLTNVGRGVQAMGAHDMPSPTLARDLGTLVGDAEYADVRFIAEGRPIPAHRFILESRCEYFKAMFRFQPGVPGSDGSISQSAASTNVGMVDVVVPDTFVAFLRLLIFIYTDTLPDGNDEALLEDLLSADRYDLRDMKTMCESMLVPSSENWLGILKVAELVRSVRLMDQVHAYLRDNFSVLNEVADVGEFASVAGDGETTYLQFLRREYPSLVEEIFQDRIGAFPPPPSQILVTKMEDNHAALDSASNAPPFPIWALVVGGIAAFLYAQSATVVSLGPVVPFVNTLFLIGTLIWGYRRLFTK